MLTGKFDEPLAFASEEVVDCPVPVQAVKAMTLSPARAVAARRRTELKVRLSRANIFIMVPLPVNPYSMVCASSRGALRMIEVIHSRSSAKGGK